MRYAGSRPAIRPERIWQPTQRNTLDSAQPAPRTLRDFKQMQLKRPNVFGRGVINGTSGRIGEDLSKTTNMLDVDPAIDVA